MLLDMPFLAKDVALFSWNMYTAVALNELSWIVITMALVIPHVVTMKMLELFVKVNCNISLCDLGTIYWANVMWRVSKYIG